MSVGERDDDEGKRHTKLGRGRRRRERKEHWVPQQGQEGSGADELNNKTLPRPIITASEGTGKG